MNNFLFHVTPMPTHLKSVSGIFLSDRTFIKFMPTISWLLNYFPYPITIKI